MKNALVETIATKYGLLDAKVTPDKVKVAVALALQNCNCTF